MLLNRLPGRGYSFIALCIVAACASNALAAHIPGQSQLGGWVYIDRNNDGQLAFASDPNPEFVIGDVTINLYKVVSNVETFVASTVSDDFGRYLFENIDPGTYDMKEVQPIEYVDGIDTLGKLIKLGGTPIPPSDSAGTASNNAFNKVILSADVGGEFYNFGERGLAPGYVSKRYLLASSPSSNTAPEPASMLLMLGAVCGGSLISRRRARD
ncbi:MAG TPA: SdrD B-like domain-containing protein [Pirellulales bacterium]|jgi:hypothetical protein